MLARTLRMTVILALVTAFTWSLAQTLVVARGTDAVTLDPYRANDSPTATVLSHIFETLFDLTPEGTVEPLLATDWALSDDGLEWTFTIREGVTFHDGTPLTAGIVRDSLMRLWDPDAAFPYRFLISQVTEMEAPDDTTFIMRTQQPFAPLLFHLTHTFTSIMNPAAIEAAGEAVIEQPVGTGPFRLASWDRNNVLELVRHDDYWGDLPQVSGVRFLTVPEGTTRMALVETGEAHVAERVPPADIARLDAHPDITVHNVSSLRTIYIYFNHTREPFTDVRVRRAINHAVNKDEIAEFVLGNVVRVSDAPIAPGIFGYSPVGQYDYDPELARQLLAEAGYPDGFTTTLFSPTGRYLQDIQITEAIQSQLAEVGINAEIETTSDFAAYLALTNEPPENSRITMALLGWGTVTGDADYGLFPLFRSDQLVPVGSNRSFYRNAVVDDLLAEARRTADQSIRDALYQDAMRLLWDDAAWLFLHSESQVVAVRDNVEGLVIHPTERVLAFDVVIR